MEAGGAKAQGPEAGGAVARAGAEAGAGAGATGLLYVRGTAELMDLRECSLGPAAAGSSHTAQRRSCQT